MRAELELASWKRPSRSATAMPSAACENTALRRSSLERSARSAARRRLTSWNTMTAPATRPSESRIGAALSSMLISAPAREISGGVVRKADDLPDSSTLSMGFSTGSRVSSLMMRNTVRSGCPSASARRPACKSLGDGIHEGHATPGVRGDDGVADAGERDFEPLPLLLQLIGALLERELSRPGGHSPHAGAR